MEEKECERCGMETKFLYLTMEGNVCHDCMSDIDDEEFEKENN